MPKTKVKDQWVAVLWEQENSGKKDKKGEVRLCDIVNLTCVPTKYRTEGCIASLKWLDTSTGKTSYHKAKVLKISSDKEALELLCINSNTGEIADPSQKIFSSEVLDKKKEEQQIKKASRTAKSKASVQICTEIEKDTSIFDEIGVNNTRPGLFKTAPPSTSVQPTYTAPSQEYRPLLTTGNTFSASLPTAMINYANNSYAPSPFSSRASQSPQRLSPKLPSARPSAASEFGYEFHPPARSNQMLLPDSCITLADSNFTVDYSTYSQPVTTFSAAAAENLQQFSTTAVSHLPISKQEYRDKLTAQELQQSVHGSAPQDSQSSEPLPLSCLQLPDSSKSKCTSEYDAGNNSDHSKDKLQRFMDAFVALSPEVTESNIRFFEAVVVAMKSTYISGNIEVSKDTTFKISQFYRSPGKGKVEIFPGTNFYFTRASKQIFWINPKFWTRKHQSVSIIGPSLCDMH